MCICNIGFGVEPRLIFRIIQSFGIHCSCRLQNECVVVGSFCKPYIGQAVGGELGMMAPALFKVSKTPDHFTVTLKTASSVYAETLDSSGRGSSPKAEVSRWTPAAETCGQQYQKKGVSILNKSPQESATMETLGKLLPYSCQQHGVRYGNTLYLVRIRGFNGGEYEDDCLLGCSSV
jgi:hypothetical protein